MADDFNIDEVAASIAESLDRNSAAVSGEEGEVGTQNVDAGTTEGEGTEAQQPVQGKSLDKPGKPAATTAVPGAEASSTTGTQFDTRPPDTWGKESQAAWSALPPIVQQEIRKREGDIAKFVQEQQPATNVANAFEKMLAPYAELYHRLNINPWQHVQSLLGAHALLVFGKPEQKVAMFRQLAQDAGIDIGKLAAGDTNADSQHVGHIRALQERIAGLEQRLTGVNERVNGATLSDLESQVEAFAKDPAHPFFEEVAADIPDLINKGAETLNEAYELAVLRNPATRAKFVEADRVSRQTAAEKAARDKAAKARKAMAGNVKGSNTGRGASTLTGLDDFLHEQLDQIHSR